MKLLRVAGLVAVVFAFSLYLRLVIRAAPVPGASRPKLFAIFLIGFAVCVLLTSLAGLPAAVTHLASTASQALIGLAVCAIGVQTSIRSKFEVGPGPLVMLTGLSVFMAALWLLPVALV